MNKPVRIEPAVLSYAANGTPHAAKYDDVYHSTEGGLAQARHVFLSGNALPERWRGRHRFTIIETGFGLGLSFLATWQAWRDDPQRPTLLHFISTELHPFSANDLATLQQHWPELAALAAELQRNWPPLTPGFHQLLLDHGRVTLTLLFGDANDTLQQLSGLADAIYLDGFAPQKNPQLWSPALLGRLTQHAAPDATLASWCVAGEVRQALKALGWQLKKRPGFGHKWQMLTGQRDASIAQTADTQDSIVRHAIVIGAGIAGCSVTEALIRRGWHIDLIEAHAQPAQEASGNPAGLLHPMLAKDDNLAARFSRAAYLYSLRLLHALDDGTLPWQATGILQVAEDEADAKDQRTSCQPFPANYVSWLNQAEASQQAGMPLAQGGWWFPHGAWVNPPALCQALLHAAKAGLTQHSGQRVAALRHAHGHWHALAADGTCIARAPHLVLANAAAASTLLPELELSLRRIRGQLSYLPDQMLGSLNTALCGAGYAIRTQSGQAVIGASFIENDEDAALRENEHQDNLDKLARMLPTLALPPAARLQGRVAFRSASHDRMPLVGQLPHPTLKPQHTLANLPRQAGLHALLGLGARGLSWGPMAAELLAAQMNHECLPLESSIVRMLDPARYQLRHIRRADNA